MCVNVSTHPPAIDKRVRDAILGLHFRRYFSDGGTRDDSCPSHATMQFSQHRSPHVLTVVRAAQDVVRADVCKLAPLNDRKG
jgi:hypothetical protein